jgi:L-rhamnose mutarotase
MKQYGRTLNLKDDPRVIETYLEYHRAVWPEVEAGLRAIGIHRMLIWILGRRLFMFLETHDSFDPARDFPRYETGHPRIKEWQDLMASMQEPVPEAAVGELWAEMKLAYRLDR